MENTRIKHGNNNLKSLRIKMIKISKSKYCFIVNAVRENNEISFNIYFLDNEIFLKYDFFEFWFGILRGFWFLI